MDEGVTDLPSLAPSTMSRSVYLEALPDTQPTKSIWLSGLSILPWPSFGRCQWRHVQNIADLVDLTPQVLKPNKFRPAMPKHAGDD